MNTPYLWGKRVSSRPSERNFISGGLKRGVNEESKDEGSGASSGQIIYDHALQIIGIHHVCGKFSTERSQGPQRMGVFSGKLSITPCWHSEQNQKLQDVINIARKAHQIILFHIESTKIRRLCHSLCFLWILYKYLFWWLWRANLWLHTKYGGLVLPLIRSKFLAKRSLLTSFKLKN